MTDTEAARAPSDASLNTIALSLAVVALHRLQGSEFGVPVKTESLLPLPPCSNPTSIQFAASTYLPPNWFHIILDDYVSDVVARLAASIPAGSVLVDEIDHPDIKRRLELPKGCRAALADFGGAVLRVTIADIPAPPLYLGPVSGWATLKNHYNFEYDVMERRLVVPVMRFDVRVKLPAGAAA